MSKIKKKSNERKKRGVYRYTAAEVAEKVGCSESYVLKIRAGMVPATATTPKAFEVVRVDKLLREKGNELLENVK